LIERGRRKKNARWIISRFGPEKEEKGRISRGTWTRSLGLADIKLVPLTKRQITLLLLLSRGGGGEKKERA